MARLDIEAVMVVALDAATPKIGDWAAKWLKDKCNVIVIERDCGAASASANDIR